MKNIFKALKFPFVFILFLSSFIACDKDFSTIDSDVLGEGNANFLTDSVSYPILAYNKKLEALQINNLASNLLGFFNDPEYGKTTASIITQLTPSSFSPDFGVNPTIEEVILNIPYFNTAADIDDDGNTTYQLDSVYGNRDVPIKLTIYRNTYFLRDFDPFGAGNSTQNYYSNASSTSNSAFDGSNAINFDDHLGEIIFSTNNFIPSNEATVTTTGEGEEQVTTRSEPAFRKVLDNAFWQETIINKQDDAVLSDANKFKNYFRGLYFKAEAVTDKGAIILLDLASTNANITINYSNGESDARIDATYTLNFTGNRLNTFINEFSPPLVDGDKDNGDETLYLKGLEGSMAVVDLFGTEDLDGNLVPDKLDEFLKEYRKTDDETGEYIFDENGNYVLKRLINEAHLAIYEDETSVINTIDKNGNAYHKYDRIYAYDIKNNTTTIDYQFDFTESNDALFSRVFSLSQRDSISPTKAKYKIRITEHLNNIIQSDSTNYNIGLVMSNNVNYTTNSAILNSNDEVTAVPSASVISPRGTILHGSNAIDDEKKLTLKIFYTETKED